MTTNYFDAELNATVAVYIGFIKTEEFLKISEKILEHAQQYGISKVLVDTSASKVMPQQNQQYIRETWIPKAVEAGILYMAFVLPQDLIGKLGVQDTNRNYANTSIQVEQFHNPTEAREWLKSK